MLTFKPPVTGIALSLLVTSVSAPMWAADAEREPGALSPTEALGYVPESPTATGVELVSYQPLNGRERWNLYVRDTF